MNRKNTWVLIVLLFVAPLMAQADGNKSIRVTGREIYEDRASSRFLYRYRADDTALGQLAVSYGRPQWKAEYDESGVFDQLTRGKVWRLGKDFWTVLDASIAFRVDGQSVAPGDYYLGLHRSQDGSEWSLVVIDAHQARKLHLDSARIEQAPALFKASATYEEASEVAESLAIMLSRPSNQIDDLVLTVAWGNHRLLVPIKVELEN